LYIQVLDIGEGYSPLDGIFDVPVTGVYVFTVTIYAEDYRHVIAELVVNGQVQTYLIADTERAGDYHTGTAIVVAQVNAGDHVFVRRGDSYSDALVTSIHGRAISSFSGWRLF